MIIFSFKFSSTSLCLSSGSLKLDSYNSIFKGHLAHFPAQVPKNQNRKIPPERNSLYFRKWSFLALILKKLFYFRKWNTALSGLNPQNFSLKNFLYLSLKKSLPWKNFLYFLKRKLFLYFHKWKPPLFSLTPRIKKIHPVKISYTSGNANPEKIYYVFLKRKPFLCFGKREKKLLKCFLYFRKWNFSTPSWINSCFSLGRTP